MTRESVLCESRGTHFKSKFQGVIGRIELTPDRIVFYRVSPLFMMFGLIGLLLSATSRGKATLKIDIADVKSIARQRQGISTKVLCFTMKDGASHRLMIEKFDAFQTELNRLLSNS